MPATIESDFLAYLRSKYRGAISYNTIIKATDRYAYAINQIESPDINLEEFNIIRRCICSTWIDIDESPIEFLQRSLDIVSCDVRSRFYTESSLKAFAGEPYDSGEPEDAKRYDELVKKIAEWTPLQGLKVLEAIECLDADHVHIVDLTPKTMVGLLHGQGAEKMR